VDKVPQIEVLESVVTNGLALSPSADLSEKRIREEAISPAELVTVDVERDGRGDRLTREARSTRWFGSLTTPRTRSGSTGQSLVVRRGDGGRFPMKHAKNIIHTGRRVIERHASVLWVVVLVGVAEWGMMGTC